MTDVRGRVLPHAELFFYKSSRRRHHDLRNNSVAKDLYKIAKIDDSIVVE